MPKAIFHIHTNYSPCSTLAIADIISLCEKHNIKYIAVTDHDAIEGALALKKAAPKWLSVIIGQEITTTKGHLIGLFLNKKIRRNLTPLEAVREIKKQSGIVVVPHPFDLALHRRFAEKALLELLGNIDLIETYNARYIYPWAYLRAQKFAKDHNLSIFAGADAHTKIEFPRTILEIAEFNTKEEFLKAAKNVKIIKNPSLLLPYILSFYSEGRRLIKRLKGERIDLQD